MKNTVYIPGMWKTIRELISSLSVFWIWTSLAIFALGIIIGILNPAYSIVVVGMIAMIIMLLLRLDELTVALIVVTHIWLDVYLNLYVVGALIELVLACVCYFGQSATRPWTSPRAFWLWIALLVLTIYPAINGASFKLSEAESYYLNLIISPFILFWLGNVIAKNISSVKRLFNILSFISVLIAIHTIIQATTGHFLFESSQAATLLAQNSQFYVVGTTTVRAGSFFIGPDGNGTFLATSLFIPLGLFVESRKLWAKVVYLLEVLLILQALIFTYSTGAWIALLVGILLFVLLAGRIRYGVLLLVLITIVALLGLTIFASQVAVQLYRINDQSTLLLHLGAWQTAIRVIEAFPLTGIGMGSQAYLVGSSPYRVPAQFVPLHEPDNSYLQWGAIAGIPVMLIFLLILGAVFWFAWRNWLAVDIRYRPLLGGGIVALVAISISSLSVDGWTSLAGEAHFAWLIAGIVASPLIGRGLPINMSDTGKHSINITNQPISSLEEVKKDSGTLMTSADARGIDETAIWKLPVEWKQKGETKPAQAQREGRASYLELLIRNRVKSPGFYAIASPTAPLVPLLNVPVELEQEEGTKPAQAQAEGSESYLGLILNLVKSSGLYALSSLSSPLVSLLLLPFLTRLLSHNDYGALAVLDTVIALLASITTLGLDASFITIRSQDCKTNREKLDALSTLSLLLLLIMIPIAIVGVMAASWLSMLLLGSTTYSTGIVLTVFLVLLQNLIIPGLMWMRVEGRAAFYSIVSVANCLLIAGGTIVLVGILHMGIVGALIAMGLGNALIVVGTLPFIFFRAGFRLRLTMAVSMLMLGIPYAMNYITMWSLQLSDRYLLGHFISLSAAASYTIAYSLGGAVGFVITQPFAMAWWVLVYPIARRDDASHVFKLIFRWYSLLLLFATLGLSLVGVSVLDLLFPVSYHGQSLIISVVALGTLFNSICVVFDLGTTLRRKMWMAFFLLLFSALLNVGINVFLIPLYSSMGAAIATLVAYIVLALVTYLFNQIIYPVPFEVGLVLAALGIGIALYFADSSFVQGQSYVIVWGIHIGILLLYAIVLTGLGIMPWQRKKAVREH